MGDLFEIKQFLELLQIEIEMERKKKNVNLPVSQLLQLSQTEENPRLFGYFKCSKCNKQWTSAHSWRNKWQKCSECEINIHPYNQEKLAKSSTRKQPLKSHNRECCQKCIELGRGCDS